MFQRDYFMRMIQQMTEAIGQIMQLRKEQKQEEGLLLLDELLEKHFHLSRKLISSLSDEDLVKVVSRNGVADAEQLQAIALLLKQEALLQNDLGKERESFGSSVRSLRLFLRLAIMKAEPITVEINNQIAELLSLLKPYELPISAKRLMLDWHEAEGRYDQVENIMHELLEDSAMPGADAAAIYRRLLKLDDEQLELGGLPREEALQGLKELNVTEEETQAEHE
ncbi:DUF6483 family protein [Paenibacillus sp. CAU 1782]